MNNPIKDLDKKLSNKQKNTKAEKDLTPVTTMKVNQDSLMALSTLQQMFYMNTRTEVFNKVMKDVVRYYEKNHEIDKTTYDLLFNMNLKRIKNKE